MSDSITIVEQQGIEVISGGPRGAAGPAGPAGPPGPAGGSTYVHNQGIPQAVWTINHNLQRYPSVTVVDSAGTQCIGEVTYIDSNTVTVTFSAGFSGVAYLN